MGRRTWNVKRRMGRVEMDPSRTPDRNGPPDRVQNRHLGPPSLFLEIVDSNRRSRVSIEWDCDMNFDLSSPVAVSGRKRKEKKRPIALKSRGKAVSASRAAVDAVDAVDATDAVDGSGVVGGSGVRSRDDIHGDVREVGVNVEQEQVGVNGRVDDGRVDDGRVDDGRVDDGRVDDGQTIDGGLGSRGEGVDLGGKETLVSPNKGVTVVGKRAKRVSAGVLGSGSQLMPVETPPTKVLLAEPLSERKARLQRGGGRKRVVKGGNGEEAGGVAEEEAGGVVEGDVVKGTTGNGVASGTGTKVAKTVTKKTTATGARQATRGANAKKVTKVTKGTKVTKATKATKSTKATTATTAIAEQAVGATDGGATTTALATTGEEALQAPPSSDQPLQQPPPSLADMPLDPEGWSLKDIVKWGSARERRMAKENAKLAPKPALAPTAPMHQRPAASLTPKVRVVDGKIVVDEESLTVAAQQKEEYTKVVTEESHTINSMSYVNRLSNDRWSVEDTELFFRALSQFGTDFSLMAMLFPGRMRKHLKKKFCKESKVSPERIDAAMRASAHATLGSYREMIDLLKNSKGMIKNG